MGNRHVYLPYFLTHRSIRLALKNLYVGLAGSFENALAISSENLFQNDLKQWKGNKLVQRCMAEGYEWMKINREFALSDSIFINQIFSPSRCVAKFIVNIRSSKFHTADLSGMVISKSSPYFSRSFNEKMISITVLFPEIESVMTLRYREEICKEVKLGTYRFEGIQPYPYINRIHPSTLKITEENRSLSMSKFNFIKLSLHDLIKASRSVSYENYCEMESYQLEYNKRRLGCVCIIGGKIHLDNYPKIIVESISEPKIRVTLYTRQDILDQDEIKLFNKKFGRVMAVIWNCLGSKMFMFPEVLKLEPVADPSELLIDDAIGFIRMRKNVMLDSLTLLYKGISLNSFPRSISIENECVRWNETPPMGNYITQQFQKQTNAIRNTRCMLNSPTLFLFLADIYDSSKLQLEGIASMMKNRIPLRNCLLYLIRNYDRTWQLPSSWTDCRNLLDCGLNGSNLRELRWLRDTFLVKKKENEIVVTKRGLFIAYLLLRKEIEQSIEDACHTINWFDITHLEKEKDYPFSILSMTLRELEKNGKIKPASIGGNNCSIFWRYDDLNKNGYSDVSHNLDIEEKYKTLMLSVLNVMKSVSYPLTVSKIKEILKDKNINLSCASLEAIERELETIGKVIRITDSWHYKWENRIYDLFRSYKNRIFFLEEILTISSIPPANKYVAIKILDDLTKNKKLSNIYTDSWTFNENISEKMVIILRTKVTNYIISLLSSRRGKMDETVVKGRTLNLLYTNFSIYMKQLSIHPINFYDQIIFEMIRDGNIIKNDTQFILHHK